ncbi:MAG: MerR family transcriptional regulator [Ewingella sp.]
MTTYDIDTTAQLCGVHPITLRTWQRHGLLKPHRTPQGQRFYSDDDLARIHVILDWVNRGVPLSQIQSRIQGEAAECPNGWREIQAEILTLLDHCNTNTLRRLIWRCGREYPSANLVNDVLRPLRRFLASSKHPLMKQQLGLLDSTLIEYTAFILGTSRKKGLATVLLVAMHIRDPLDMWLEAMLLAGEGLRIELIAATIAEPDLSRFKMEHYVIWSDRRLNERQQALFQGWEAEGLPVMLVGKVKKLPAAAVQPQPATLNTALIEKLIYNGV